MPDTRSVQPASDPQSAQTMRVIEIAAAGSADVLRAADRPVPDPGPGQVLIAVAASGVNRPDVMQREGAYPPPPGASDILGLEVAGTVMAVGRGVAWPRVGDPVMALVAGGGYASHCLAEMQLCLPIPSGMSFIQAAGIPENWFTVYDHLVRICRLRAGQSLLIHGGGSGIGVAAIQLARLIGADVYTTVGSAAKAQRLEGMGCACVINYREQDFVDVIRQRTHGRGVDAVVDMVGGSYMARNIDIAAQAGTISMIAALDGLVADGIRIDQIMLKRLTITGNTLRDKSLAYKARLARGLRQRVWPFFGTGELIPIVDRVFPLEQAADAHRLMESSHHFGKIILSNVNSVDE